MHKNKYDHNILLNDIQKLDKIQHKHSLVAIRFPDTSAEKKYLVYYDERWDCKLFLNYKTVDRADEESVYYALGNHELDYIGAAEGKKMQKHPEDSGLVKDLTDAGACVLEEGYRDVEIGGCKVRIGGMYEYAFALDGDNSAENLTGDVRDFLEEFQNTDRYKIMLCHRPDSFVFGDASDYWKIDLVISGHDHGGQVVIPFKGGLYGGDQGWFPPYVHGLYRTGRIRLFVTSGLSSEKQKLPRWNNRPEIAVLNVH